MKILIVGPVPPPINGCSLANSVLIDNIKRDYRNIEIYTINTNTNNISSKTVGGFSFRKIVSFIKSYRNIGLVRKADVVYTTPGQTFFGIAKYIPFYFMALVMSKPYIIHIHGNHLGNEFSSLKGFKKKLFAYFIQKADAGIVLSRLLRPNFIGLLNDNRVFEVANFAENQLLENCSMVKAKDKLRLLYLSNLMAEKGILDFLECLEILKSNNVDFVANIAGKIEDELEEILTEKFKSLDEAVIYHGVVKGEFKKKLLMESNVFVMPTYYRMEGQPIAIIEAMATGNIIVTTNYSGIPDLVTSLNGFFVESENPNSISDTLTDISINLQELVSQISILNSKYVKQNFTETIFANNVLNVIHEVSRAK